MKKQIFAAICSVTMMAGAAAFTPALDLTADNAIVASAVDMWYETIGFVRYGVTYTNDINSMADYKIVYAANQALQPIDVTIPTTVAGKPVTAIGDNIFMNTNRLKAVSVPNGIATIGDNFLRNSTVTNINFNGNLYVIGDDCFRDTTSLKNVNIPSMTHTIGNNFCYHATGLQTINFGTAVQTVGSSCCEGCTSLKTANLNSNLEYLGDYAFYGCSAMTAFNCPSTHLGDGWTGPDIGGGILWANKWADDRLSNPNTTDLIFGSGSFLYRYVKKLTSNTNITYSNVKYVYDYAFGGDAWTYGNKVRKVYLPAAERIGHYAFKKCPYATVYLSPSKMRATYGSNYRQIVEQRCAPATVNWNYYT